MADYISLSELKSWLHVSDTTDDTLYSLAITAASRAIDQACNRRFDKDSNASARVYIAQQRNVLTVHDISATSGLIVATDEDANGAYETTWTLGTDYNVEPAYNAERPITRLRAVARWFPLDAYQRPRVQVTAKWGWPAAVPEPIKLATLILATRFVKRKDSPEGVLGFGTDGFAVRVTAQDKDVASLIAPYKRVRYA